MTRMRSKSMIVWSRCATVTTVHPSKPVRIVSCTLVSVARSTEAVASSIRMILGFLSNTRARHISCTIPALRTHFGKVSSSQQPRKKITTDQTRIGHRPRNSRRALLGNTNPTSRWLFVCEQMRRCIWQSLLLQGPIYGIRPQRFTVRKQIHLIA